MRAAARAADMNLRASLIELDVQQDRPRTAIIDEMVEQIGEIDIDAVADRDNSGESDAPARRPLYQPRSDRTGLRYQRQVARRRRGGSKARIELCPRYLHAEAIGADQPHAGRAGNFLAALRERAGTATEPGGDDDADGRAFARRRCNGVGHRGRRHSHGDDVGRLWQRVVGFKSPDALDLVIARIDQIDRTWECGLAKIRKHRAAGRCGARRRADDGDRAGREQRLEAIRRH